MTVQIGIKTNAIEAKHFFDMLERQQLPFAISRAVNRLAYDARDQEQGKIGDFFTLRTDWLLKKGAMPVVPSRKGQFPDIHAILGVKDEIAAMAATGGEKKGRTGDVAVPFSNTGGGASTRETLNPGKRTLGPRTWPGRIVKKGTAKRKKARRNGSGMVLLNNEPKPFIIKGKSGRTFVAKRAGKDDPSLEILYELLPKVEVGKLWPLITNVEAFVATNYNPYLVQALDDAIKSPRGRRR